MCGAKYHKCRREGGGMFLKISPQIFIAQRRIFFKYTRTRCWCCVVLGRCPAVPKIMMFFLREDFEGDTSDILKDEGIFPMF